MNKIPQVTLAFWLIKIFATTLGETGGDVLSMTLRLGYALSTVVFLGLFVIAVLVQIASRSYRPFLYWGVILATTTAGTTMSDMLDRTLGLGYLRGSLLLLAVLAATLAAWRLALGSVTYDRIASHKVEAFYWVTILVSNTLGTALGDAVADTTGLGYEGGALVFGGAIALIAVAYLATGLSRTLLFWAAFVLTRPLGATLGDELTKPYASGGLNLGTIASSVAIGSVLVALVALTSARAGKSSAGP